ncbi:Hypothetical protein PHPALM_12067 [Phytophthora palmivora]|uniref:Uncharacterized protein n=1 Tax=Phytophthora palmivora TaxID=4796 RepID=A0A2P4Y0P7_9STRA|nr:Hypothetical protein PHPALM_12067 [Phytophthora palmivora]
MLPKGKQRAQSIVTVLPERWVLTHTPDFPHEGHGYLLFLEQLMDPRPSAGGHTFMVAYECHLIKGVPLFI